MVTIKPLIQKTILFLVMILFLLAAGSARAGFNMYLFISDSSGTITGEVTNTGFAGQIWVTNFSWGVVNPVSSGGTVGKPWRVSRSKPSLEAARVNGTHGRYKVAQRLAG